MRVLPGLWLLLAATPGLAGPPPIALAPVARGLDSPLFVTQAPGETGTLYVLEQPGRMRVIRGTRLEPLPFLDIRPRVKSGGEQGLLGLAFHPRFATNGRLFLNYTREPDGATVVSEFIARGGKADPRSERMLLTVAQPWANHNGGMLAFGPDGFLYIALGDGGLAADPGNRAQDRNELLGKILRIDVDRGRPYGIPADNSFARGSGRPEIFALGLRNPWRFSFDRATGELWAADVGQDAREEVNRITRGGNYGWRVMEGSRCFLPPVGCERRRYIAPVAEYPHADGRCSITGGYVYRGRAIPAIKGKYLFGDFCTGEVMTTDDGGGVRVLLDTDAKISSFGEDADGEIYLTDLAGTVYRIVSGR